MLDVTGQPIRFGQDPPAVAALPTETARTVARSVIDDQQRVARAHREGVERRRQGIHPSLIVNCQHIARVHYQWAAAGLDQLAHITRASQENSR